MSAYDTFIHLLAGGVGGTIGAIITCPLEVVKTRQQSSVSNLNEIVYRKSHSPRLKTGANRLIIWNAFKHIIDTEGARALFKGLGPNLIGVAPSRAVYFCTYSTVKNVCNDSFKQPDTPFVHMSAAAAAGFVSCTATNPIWFIKTRLQLDQNKYGATTTWKCIKKIYRELGIFGFYKGITASYYGISETIIHFVIYEFIVNKLKERRNRSMLESCDDASNSEQAEQYHLFQFMAAGAISKTCASILAYPHEVARTRLRQEGDKYASFVQTLRLVWLEEGRVGLYRGLSTQLMRQIPNTAIMMATYELILYLCKSNNSGTSGDVATRSARSDDSANLGQIISRTNQSAANTFTIKKNV